MIVIGSKGCGKSTLCNIISGRLHNDDSEFVPDSDKSEFVNEMVISKEKWNGNGFDLVIIDTPDFTSSTEGNTDTIYEMSKELEGYQSIDLFLIVLHFDQSNESFHHDLKKVLNTFKQCFGAEFLKSNAVIASWSEYEESKMNDLMMELGFEIKIPVICIDSFYSLNDDGRTVSLLRREESRFKDQLKVLKNFILNSKKYVGKGTEGVLTLLDFFKEELEELKEKNEELKQNEGKDKEDILNQLECSKEELEDMKQKNEELKLQNFNLQKNQSALDWVGK